RASRATCRAPETAALSLCLNQRPQSRRFPPAKDPHTRKELMPRVVKEANSRSRPEPLKPTHHPALAESADDDQASAARQLTLPALTRVRKPGTVSPPGCAPPHIDTFAARPWSHRTG